VNALSFVIDISRALGICGKAHADPLRQTAETSFCTGMGASASFQSLMRKLGLSKKRQRSTV
jgi:hypothetical protein